MTRYTRFAIWIPALCLGLAVACTSGTDGGTAGNTEINLDIVNPGGTSGELGFSIDRVDYRVTCAGNPPGSYPIPGADTTGTDYNYNDAVDISGAFEVVDTRDPPVWQAVMDLPPGDCTITLSVWDGDEVVCIGSQTLTIAEDATTKYDIVLVCSLSIDLPDGMADVDGTFTFITGNLCPKLYVLNAIPSGQPPPGDAIPVQESGPFVGQAVTEVQYRAKDPDNTCGNNCDPQTCTFDNPPVCTPYPSNSLDPNCNPNLGGDPNSAGCQAGDFAGLVCLIAAYPSASTPGNNPPTGPTNPGHPFGGQFVSPQDETTEVGPILPVNLNLASGVPGIILPGLGGPQSIYDNPSEPVGSPGATSPGDNPLYPGLPNVNGSLPPLVYSCDLALPGPVLIGLTCSDGDQECNQDKTLTIVCPGENFCVSQPVDCSGAHDCATDGTCDPFCDPVCDPNAPEYDQPACDASSSGGVNCDRCPGQNDTLPDGTACNVGELGTTGNVCLLGFCVECIISENVPGVGNPNCDSSPIDCLEPSFCASNVCQPRATSPAGTPCSNGECDGTGDDGDGGGPADCQFVAVDPDPVSQLITVGCGNNVTADVSILPYTLDVDPGPVVDGQAITADLGGVAEFSETFLDAAQGAIVGGVTKAGLVDLNADVQVRQGTTVPNDVVASMGAGSAIPYECWLSDTGPGAQEPCDPVNNVASVPGAVGNTDCAVVGPFNPCVPIVAIPISNDCGAGGTCDTLGKLSQCTSNTFCVTGGLPLPLDAQTGVSLGTADLGSGDLLIGWYDTPADASAAVGTPPIDGDNTYNMQQASYTGFAGPIGIAVFAGLQVQLECVMAEDSGGPDGVGVPDDASPTPDANLIQFTVQDPTP